MLAPRLAVVALWAASLSTAPSPAATQAFCGGLWTDGTSCTVTGTGLVLLVTASGVTDVGSPGGTPPSSYIMEIRITITDATGATVASCSDLDVLSTASPPHVPFTACDADVGYPTPATPPFTCTVHGLILGRYRCAAYFGG